MPEMSFRVRWPDGEVGECYSPSTVIREHLTPGVDYALADFHARARTALETANKRVVARFGMGCSGAINQLLEIDRRVASFSATPDATVRVESFHP